MKNENWDKLFELDQKGLLTPADILKYCNGTCPISRADKGYYYITAADDFYPDDDFISGSHIDAMVNKLIADGSLQSIQIFISKSHE